MMKTKDGHTGIKFEQKVASLLKENGYNVLHNKQRNEGIPLQRNGKRHYIDIRLNDGRLVSCKYNGKVYGTAEEKIPFECLKLQAAIEDSEGRITEAFIVLGGDKWHNKDWYLSEEFRNSIHMPNVKIIDEKDINIYFPKKEIID